MTSSWLIKIRLLNVSVMMKLRSELSLICAYTQNRRSPPCLVCECLTLFCLNIRELFLGVSLTRQPNVWLTCSGSNCTQGVFFSLVHEMLMFARHRCVSNETLTGKSISIAAALTSLLYSVGLISALVFSSFTRHATSSATLMLQLFPTYERLRSR